MTKPRMIGYARVSTRDQNPTLQLDALRLAGCVHVFVDQASGAKRDRPKLTETLAALKPGDTLVVWKLDRLARSVQHLVDLVAELEARGVGFKSLTEAIDTTSPGGRLVFHIFSAIAQFERDLIRERVCAGLAAFKAAGKRRKSDLAPETVKQIMRRLKELPRGGRLPAPERIVAAEFGLHRGTVYRIAAAARAA